MIYRITLLATLLISVSQGLISQTDTLKTVPVDTSTILQADTAQMQPAAPAAVVQDTVPPAPEEKAKHAKYDKFKVAVGLSAGELNAEPTRYSSEARFGYLVGFSYQRGRFFYWEAGADYNNSIIELTDRQSSSPLESNNFDLRSVDIPVSVGMNILSITDRILGLRVFAGATPSFIVGVGDNTLGISKNNTNTFNMYGHAGLGVNVAFLFIEAIYKQGFTDVLTDYDSKPWQFQVRVGFRF